MGATQAEIDAAIARIRAARAAHDAIVEDVMRRLTPAFETAVEVLATLTSAEWDALAVEEIEHIRALLQYAEALGPPQTGQFVLPEMVLGSCLLGMFTARNPLFKLEPEGCA